MSTRLAALTVILLSCVAAQSPPAPTGVAPSSQPYPIPILLNLGDNFQAAVDAAPSGQEFLIKAGTHRLQSVSPKEGQSFRGETGAVMSGASILPSASFVAAGAFWKIGGQTQGPAPREGFCQMTGPANGATFAVSYPACNYREELFVDDARKVHVQTLGELAAGKWFFDYDADEIYVGDNPAGHLVETSVTTMAFQPTAYNVTVQHLTIEKYASIAQYGAVNAEWTSGWAVIDNVIRLNHGGGIRIGYRMQVLRNTVVHNGQIGVVGSGDDVLVQDNEIAYNNEAHFDPGWEGGATKFAQTKRLVARGNRVHHNEGPGLWTDIDNLDTLYEGNTVEDNDHIGIFHEISYAAVIRNNTVRRNGHASWVPKNYVWGVGILVAASPNVEISGNIVEDNAGGIAGVQQARGSGAFGPHEIDNLNVTGNTIKQSEGWTGLVQGVGDATYFTSRNNRFEGNVYQLHSDTNYFVWADVGWQSFGAWNNYGHDTPTGSATTY